MVAACDIGFHAEARLPREILQGEARVGGDGPGPNILVSKPAELAHGLVVPVPSLVAAKKTHPQRLPVLGPADRAEARGLVVQSQVIEVDPVTRGKRSRDAPVDAPERLA